MKKIEWTDAMQTKLRTAYCEGKYHAARCTFPELTRGQLGWAVQRYVFDWYAAHRICRTMTIVEVRERLAALDAEEVLHGVSRLFEDRHGPITARRVA